MDDIIICASTHKPPAFFYSHAACYAREKGKATLADLLAKGAETDGERSVRVLERSEILRQTPCMYCEDMIMPKEKEEAIDERRKATLATSGNS